MGRCKLPGTTEANAAAEELLDYEIWVSEELIRHVQVSYRARLLPEISTDHNP